MIVTMVMLFPVATLPDVITSNTEKVSASSASSSSMIWIFKHCRTLSLTLKFSIRRLGFNEKSELAIAEPVKKIIKT